MSQNIAILEYLKSGHSLTGLDALKLFGTMKLASRISELKDEGHNILDETIHDTKTGKHYKKYWLSDEPPRPENEEALAHNYQIQEEKINLKEVNKQLSFI